MLTVGEYVYVCMCVCVIMDTANGFINISIYIITELHLQLQFLSKVTLVV